MDWLRPYLISRARVAALRALVEAGGKPQGWQLRRAVEPVLGDLLHVAPRGAAGGADRRRALEAAAASEAEVLRREAWPRIHPAGELFDAVFTGGESDAQQLDEKEEGPPW